MATGPGGTGGESRSGRDDAEFEESFRRMCRGLRERVRALPRPIPLTPAESEQRERVRLRALSLLGVMRPEVRDLDTLGWGEALEKVCDAIIDLWICEECHEEGNRCTCPLGLWEERIGGEDDADGEPDVPPPPGWLFGSGS